MSTPTPTLNGQVIAVTHYATRAVLERVLAPAGLTYHQSVALNVMVANGGSADRDPIVDRMTDALKIDRTQALEALAALTSRGLLSEQPGEAVRVALTDAGTTQQRDIASTVGQVTTRLYADLTTEELTTAGRVLTLLTERANAELAGS